MSICPKNKSSKGRRDKRRANWKMTAPTLVKCSKCGALTVPHRVCKACGTYNKKEIIKQEASNSSINCPIDSVGFFIACETGGRGYGVTRPPPCLIPAPLSRSHKNTPVVSDGGFYITTLLLSQPLPVLQ